jgi:hypothetical protein
MKQKRLLLVIMAGLLAIVPFLIKAQPAAPGTVRIAYVTDGPSETSRHAFDVFRREVEALLAGEFKPEFVGDGPVEADWTVDGVKQVIDGLMSDRQVDVVIAGGIASSQYACSIESPEKLVIAPLVFDVR